MPPTIVGVYGTDTTETVALRDRDRAPKRPAGWLRGGVPGNARLTGAVAAALLVLLAAEGVTIPFIGQLLGPHIFIGLMLVPPVLLKLGSTGYRFARYYGHAETYVEKGPPALALALRLLAPGVVLTTLALFGTGIALALAGPPSHTLAFAHKLSFIAWVALMTIHVLGHVLEVPALAVADWRRRDRIGGAGQRSFLLAASILVGVAVGVLGLSVAAAWA